jgi:hypothetical protein
MATERRYVLENRGQYVDGAGNVGDLWRAHAYDSIHDAYVEAQRFVRIGIRSHFRAVPVERETERTVEKHPARKPQRYLLQTVKGESTVFGDCPVTFTEYLHEMGWTGTWAIPVEVTEAPGPWRVVESDSGP